jgi:hypothetical protein
MPCCRLPPFDLAAFELNRHTGAVHSAILISPSVTHLVHNQYQRIDSQPLVAQMEEHGTIIEHLYHLKVAGSIPVQRKSFCLYPNGEDSRVAYFFTWMARVR